MVNLVNTNQIREEILERMNVWKLLQQSAMKWGLG